MPDSDPGFFSREELLSGLPARQASTLLFAIKSRTAYLMAQSWQAAARFTPPKTAELHERAFLEALAQGRDSPLRQTIQDLERYAPEWAALVPDNPGVKAAIADMLAKEYIFTYQHTPRLRQALSLEDEAVKEAYQRYYNQPLQIIYTPKITPREHLRWLWAGLTRWLEELPPFWIAFALTLTETVGASILALPIALAGAGPLAGVVLLLVFGLINILTIRLLLTNIAHQAGAVAHAVQLTAALQQSRQQLVTAREEERRRLRRDLHDGLGPQLASQTLTLNAIGKLLERDPAKARELLDHLQTQSQAAIEDIRRLVYDLRPPALDELGLVAALREGARQYGQVGKGVEITTDPQPLPTLPAAVEVAVYRIAQEAITNVIRHTQAKQCHVAITVQDHHLDLIIADDGPGFPPDLHFGVGLNSMRERAEELGGHIRFENQPEGGARVQIWLPLPGDEE